MKKGPLAAGLFFVLESVTRTARTNVFAILYLLVFAGAALYLFSPIFQSQLGAIGHNDQRALSSILIALGAALAAFSIFRPVSRALSSWYEHVVWLVVLLGLTAAAMSADPLRSLLEISLYLCLFYLVVWLYQYYRTLGSDFVCKSLSQLAVAFVSVYTVAFLFSYATWLFLPEFYCSSCVMPHFDNMRAFNDVQMWLIPFLWYFALQERSTYFRKILAFAPAVFLSALLFYTTARGATLAVLVAMAFVGYRYRSRARGFTKVAVATVVLGWLLNLLLTRLLPFLIDRPLPRDILDRLSSGSSGRMELWKAALDMLLHNPLFGVGPQHYAHELYQNYEHLRPFGSPHNIFLTFLAEWGLVAGSLLSLGILWFMYRVIRGPVRTVSKDVIAEKQVAEATAISVFVSSMFAGTLLTPLSQMMLVLFAPALLLVSQRASGSDDGVSIKAEINKKGHYGYMMLLLSAAFFLLGMTIYDIVVHKDVIFITTETAYPRYWQNGFFWRY